MKGLTFQGIQNVAFVDVPNPKIELPGDVIVKTNITAICGSDLHVYHGREKGIDPGTVMGHEFIGEVVEVGADVKKLKKGDKVFSPFFSACGECYYCKKNLSCRCEKGQLFGWVEGGKGLQGAQAEYVRVPLADTTLTVIPENISDEEALLLCDILPTGFFCAYSAEPSGEKVIAVIGAGPVGLLTIVALKEYGVQKIFSLDMIPERLKKAEELGAIPINVSLEEEINILFKETGGRGVDAVCEAVGSPSAQSLAYKLVRPGGILSVVGVHTENNFSFSPTQAYDKNITYKTGRCPVQFFLSELIPLVQKKKYDFSFVFSHRLPLSEGKKGYKIFDQKIDNCSKVILKS